jgi:hypothetical protein
MYAIAVVLDLMQPVQTRGRVVHQAVSCGLIHLGGGLPFAVLERLPI